MIQIQENLSTQKRKEEKNVRHMRFLTGSVHPLEQVDSKSTTSRI